MTWIIPAIALAVWILSSLARNPEPKKPERPRPQERPQARTAEIDRFLEEINERRRKEGQPPAAPPPPPRQKPKPARAQERRPTPPRLPPRQTEEIPVAVPIPVVDEAPVVLPASALVRPMEAPLSAIEMRPMAAAPPPRPARRRASPSVLELIQSSGGIRTAFLVSEILGPPRVKRPYRRR